MLVEVEMPAWDRTTLQTLPSTEVTHLHLLRHGKPDTGGQRRCYGHTDLSLSTEGLAQTRAITAWASEHLPPLDGILSSDLGRARVMAESLSQATGAPVLIDTGLREQHMGEWEGRTWAELTQADVQGVRRFWSHYATMRPPGGENLEELSERVADTMARHWPKLRGGRWAVAGHVGVIRVVLCRMLGLPTAEALRFAPVPGSHTWLQLAQAGAVVQVLGERPLASDPGIVAAAHGSIEPRRQGGLRVAMCGSAGTGKTRLAKALATKLGLPYIPEGMRERLEAGLDIQSLDHGAFRRLVVSMWAEQCAREDAAVAELGGFVADRSPWDHAAFWLQYGVSDEVGDLEPLFAQARARSEALDRLVVLPWGSIPLVADGVRSPSRWRQRAFQATVEGLVHREANPATVAFLPMLADFDERMVWMMDLLRESGTAQGYRLDDASSSATRPGSTAAIMSTGD